MSPLRAGGAEKSERSVRRLPVVVALLVVLVAALAAGDPEPPRPPEAPSTRNAVALPASGARSSAWYCPGAPPSDAVPVATGVSITNTGMRDTAAVITVMTDGGRVASRRIKLPAGTVVPFRPSEMTDIVNPAIVVEPFSAEVVVEQDVWTRDDLAAGPCATQPAAHWYFANGTTVRGVEQWLILFNPFGDDAIVDLSFHTDEGRKEVEALRGIDVPRHSRVAVRIHDHVRRQAYVAAEVTSRVGRVVAQQSQVFLPDSGRSGITSSLGSPSAALEWWFPFGHRRSGETRTIGISNPGDLDTEVDVQVFAEGDAFIEPVTVSIPRRSAVLVNLGDCGEGTPSCVNVPRNLAYQALVSSATDVLIVAEELAVYADADVPVGAMSSLGGRGTSRRWVFGRSRYANERRSNLVIGNPGADPVEVTVTLVRDGELRVPSQLDAFTIDAGRRVVVDLSSIEPEAGDAGVVVDASQPVVAAQAVIRSKGISVHSGIPERE